MVMALSATLKTGQMRKSRKSITAFNLRRSMRLLAAPDNIRASAIFIRGIFTRRKLIRMKIMAAAAIKINK